MKPEIQVNGSKTLENQESALDLAGILKDDERVQVAGIDCDGQLRGKVMSKEKFLSIVNSGFGMSSAIFGWDMHDMLFEDNKISSSEAGYADFTSMVDELSMRRLPWANNMPFFLITKCLQSADAEHQCYANLLPPGQLQMENLVEWDCQHPQIQRNTDTSISPGQSVNVNTMALMLPIPALPVKADRSTLEDGCHYKSDSV